MKTRAFGPTGVSLPVIGQGTWRMENDDRQSCIAALRRGIELGMTHLDTAELYGSGRVEHDIVREVVKGVREKLYLVSKVMPSNADFDGTLRACEQSLSRIGTDRLDLYLLHWPGAYPLEETVSAFEQLVKDGKIRAWGVSNFDAEELQEVVSIAGPGKVACNQVLYHLKERAIEHRVLPLCRKNGIAVVGYSPFGAGAFVAQKSPGYRALEEVAKKHDATARQVALAFLSREKDLFTIPKAAATSKVEDNAGAGDLTLDAADLGKIDGAFPVGRSKELPVI